MASLDALRRSSPPLEPRRVGRLAPRLAGFGAGWVGGGWSGHIGVGGRQTVAHEERICDLGGELGGVALVWLSAILEGDREAV